MNVAKIGCLWVYSKVKTKFIRYVSYSQPECYHCWKLSKEMYVVGYITELKKLMLEIWQSWLQTWYELNRQQKFCEVFMPTNRTAFFVWFDQTWRSLIFLMSCQFANFLRGKRLLQSHKLFSSLLRLKSYFVSPIVSM